jgi:hypothetical protein
VTLAQALLAAFCNRLGPGYATPTPSGGASWKPPEPSLAIATPSPSASTAAPITRPAPVRPAHRHHHLLVAQPPPPLPVQLGPITVALQLAPDEPEAGPWRTELLTVVATTVMQSGQGKGAGHRPVVLAMDGRSSSGKTTLAGRLRDVVAGSAVVHTDDIAWWHSRFGWADLLIDGVLLPARAGQPVTFRPPQWDQRQRPGAIEVPAGCPLLIIEGVGAARRESVHLVDAAIWVQSDEREAERRSLARVGWPGGALTLRHHRDWMAEEMPFLAGQRPWERADLIICGTPEISFDPATELIVAPPPTRTSARRSS